MSFARPEWLFALIIPFLLLLKPLWAKARATPMPHDHAGAPRRRLVGLALAIAAALPPLVLAAAIIAIAGPLRLSSEDVEREVTNIEICLDVSGSMGWGMGASADRTRNQVAVEAIERFTAGRKGDACGLTIFGGEQVRWTPLTKDLKAIAAAAPFLDPRRMPPHMQSTRIGAALRTCLSTLRLREQGDRLIVLISDGESQDLGPEVSREIGDELGEERVALYAIHIGDGAPPQDLYTLVEQTRGEVLAAEDPRTLQAVFAHIDRMVPAKIKPKEPQALEDYSLIALIGLGCVLLQTLSLLGLRTVPW